MAVTRQTLMMTWERQVIYGEGGRRKQWSLQTEAQVWSCHERRGKEGGASYCKVFLQKVWAGWWVTCKPKSLLRALALFASYACLHNSDVLSHWPEAAWGKHKTWHKCGRLRMARNWPSDSYDPVAWDLGGTFLWLQHVVFRSCQFCISIRLPWTVQFQRKLTVVN